MPEAPKNGWAPGRENWFPVVDGANQVGELICTKNWPPNTKVADRGDWVSFEGTRALNPITLEITEHDLICTVLWDAFSDDQGRAELRITSIDVFGPYRNAACVIKPICGTIDGARLGYITERPSPEFAEAAVRLNG